MNNPYITIVSKKLRNLRKRLTRVDEIELLALDGKALENAQLSALAGKDALVDNITSLEQIMVSMKEVVAMELAEDKATSGPKKDAEVDQEVHEIQKAMDESLKIDEDPGPGDIDIQERMRMVVCLLHVCESYTSKTGKALPAEVEYFYSVVLGKASVSDFTSTLESSLKGTGLFMFVSTLSVLDS